ncbi:MAG: hypothetical protein Q9216_005393 [Gyalolechia sp. 2 TL-2023]
MGAFWNSWELWVKLCFILGTGIVLVVFAGLIKQVYTHWKLRKYTALAKTKAARKEEALQRNPSAVRRKKGNDIPFGVRAIESGIEVDGVWISRSNTPANSNPNSTPGSPELSANRASAPQFAAQTAPSSDRASTVSNTSRLEIPQATHGHPRPDPRLTSASHTRVTSNPFDRSNSSERLPSRPGSSFAEYMPRGRPSYQPRRSSHLRFSNSHPPGSAEALATLEGRQLASKTGSKSSQASTEYELSEQRPSDDSWSGSSGETQPQGTSHHPSGVFHPVPVKPSLTQHKSSDLDSLASHRQSHAAETGQLFPRVRVNDAAGEWASVQQPAEHRNFLPDRSGSPMGLSNDPFATPQTTPLMTPSQEPSRGPPSFEEFVRSTSPQGLKSADQILRKCPKHGDTQAMKALIINAQGNTDEAFILCKEALKNAMKSHVCWHVYGLLWRCIKNYEEAIKAYKFALKLEPDSQQILRDLALLQIQMRDYQGYIQSRRIILQSKSPSRQNNSNFRLNWTALAVAQHLAGDLYDAERTLTTFEETLRSIPPRTDNEHSEALLYKNTIIAEAGETERALEHLEAIFNTNLDRTAVMEMRAQYLLRLDRKQEAEKAYRALLDRNAEYRAYYDGLRNAMGIADSDIESLKTLYDEYARKNPRGDTARRVPLDFLHGDQFTAAADQYLQQMLHKGVPSTFANIKSLYSDSAKREIIQKLAESYLDGSHAPLANGSAEKQVNGEESSEVKKPSFDISVLYFLAQHYNYHLSRDLTRSMEMIDRAIEAQPEEVNFQMTKARIWKHHGNLQKASEAMEKARSLDERDRYINSKAAKYQLRNDENEAAIMNMGKFTRKEAIGGPLGDLTDMQCIWYATEDGEAYLRQGKFGLALKRFTTIYDIFETWQEDQFDFHTFSLRKGQVRAYIDMLKWEDHLREHPFFSKAAISAIKIYIMLYDDPKLAKSSNGLNGDLRHMDSNERKKAQKRARKVQEKQEQAEAEKKDAQKTASVGTDGEVKKEDLDPQGSKLVQTNEPLVAAMKFLTPLLEYSPKTIGAQQVGFEVLIRRKKYLSALRCLLAAQSIDSSHPLIFEQSIRLRYALKTLPEPLPPKISESLESEFSHMIPANADLLKMNSDFLAKNSESAAHVQTSLRVRQILDPETSDDNQKDVIRTLALPSASLADAVQGQELLKNWGVPSRYQDDYTAAAHERWPEATAFMSKGH